MEFISKYNKLVCEYYKVSMVDIRRKPSDDYVIFIPQSDVLVIRNIGLSSNKDDVIRYSFEERGFHVGPMFVLDASSVYTDGAGSHDLGVTFYKVKMQMAPVSEPAIYYVPTHLFFDMLGGLRTTYASK